MVTAGDGSRRVLRNGVVFDGTGANPYRADVAIEGGRIAEVGSELTADDVVDLGARHPDAMRPPAGEQTASEKVAGDRT